MTNRFKNHPFSEQDFKRKVDAATYEIMFAKRNIQTIHITCPQTYVLHVTTQTGNNLPVLLACKYNGFNYQKIGQYLSGTIPYSLVIYYGVSNPRPTNEQLDIINSIRHNLEKINRCTSNIEHYRELQYWYGK